MKPWEYKGRRMERNAPTGTRCTSSCTHPRPTEAQCLCTVCHEVFGGERNFDRHRKDGWCINPATMGLHLNDAGVWRSAMRPEGRSALRGKPQG